jgi:hypothetical protein
VEIDMALLIPRQIITHMDQTPGMIDKQQFNFLHWYSEITIRIFFSDIFDNIFMSHTFWDFIKWHFE